MIFGSVCSGIEAASVAWNPLEWECAFVSEIEPFPSAVLAHHYSDVPNLGDFTKIEASHVRPIDVLIGGTPCQDFSVAGLRAGLDGKHGQLAVEFARLLGRLRPRWFVWENVPGVLSIDKGKAFGAFLGALGECGYGFAYRVLDAQFAGVPQRRRRVFVVGHLGDWRRAAAVLLERESLSGNPPPSRETRQKPALCVTSRLGSGRNDPTAETYIVFDPNQITSRENRSNPKPGGVVHALPATPDPPLITHTLRADGFDASEDGTGRGIPLVTAYDISSDAIVGISEELSQTVRARHVVGVFMGGQGAKVGSIAYSEDSAPTLKSGSSGTNLVPSLLAKSVVRRLTPRECERLQGFPDDHTLVPYRKKPAADGPRYRAIGNSMAVPVIRWIGERMQMVDNV